MPLVGVSSSTTRPRDGSSIPIDDDIYECYPNLSFDRLELWKANEEPARHEFVILHMTADSPGAKQYRIERRPSEGANITSKLGGCGAEDTITPNLNQSGPPLCLEANKKIDLHFHRAEPKPDLYTVFAICNAIRMDPESEQYTLREFNCYFFARTLTLLIARHFFLHQYCRIHKPPRNDLGSLPGPEIDDILIEATNSGTQELRRCIAIKFQKTNSFQRESYKDFRQYILNMNKRHCDRVTLSGGNGDAVGINWDKKMEEMWSRVYSDPTSENEDEDEEDVVYDTLDKEEEEIWPRRRSNPTMGQFLAAGGARSNRRPPPQPPRADYSYHQSYSPQPPPGPDYSYHQSYSPRRHLIPNSTGVAHPTLIRHRGPRKPAFNNYGFTPTYYYAPAAP